MCTICYFASNKGSSIKDESIFSNTLKAESEMELKRLFSVSAKLDQSAADFLAKLMATSSKLCHNNTNNKFDMKLELANNIKTYLECDTAATHKMIATDKMNEILKFDTANHTAADLLKAESKSGLDSDEDRLLICESTAKSATAVENSTAPTTLTLSSQPASDDGTLITNTTNTAKSTTTAKLPLVAATQILRCSNSSNSRDAFEKTDPTPWKNNNKGGSAVSELDNSQPPTTPAVLIDADRERVLIKCKWKDCGMDIEDLYLLDHLKVIILFIVFILQHQT